MQVESFIKQALPDLAWLVQHLSGECVLSQSISLLKL